MTTDLTAYTGAAILDGETIHKGHALLCEGGRVKAVAPPGELPEGCTLKALQGGLICPGFVDLQVNGGGGVMLNDAPSPETIATICKAHLPFGTTSLLPTLITDTPARMRDARRAARAALAQGVEGVIGLHFEGPHIAPARKGAHDPALIRPMEAEDLAFLEAAAAELPTLMITLAPESARPEEIRALAAAGAIVSLGHSDADYPAAMEAVRAGATCTTHLFNAMSQLAARAPGLVGAALESGALHAGLIADGIHVDPATIRIALRAKAGPGRIFLVTDAMAVIGSDLAEFTLNGRRILRRDGRLTLADGTLAGADLDMISAVRFMVESIGIGREEALRMASLYPAELIGRSGEIGRLAPGTRADFLHLDDDLDILGVWQGGIRRLP